MESWRKLLCLFLAMVMCLSLMPLSAFAAGEEDGQNPEEELTDVLNEDPAEEGQAYESGDESGDVTDEPTDSGEGDQTGDPGNIPADEPTDNPGDNSTDDPADDLAEESQEETDENEDEEDVEIASIIDSGSCGLNGDNLIWTLDDEGNLVISGTGEMAGEPSWRINGSSIKTVVLEYGVTSVGTRAFAGCDNLTDIILPDSLESVGDSAFCNCKAITGIQIPDCVTTIGEGAFQGCSGLADKDGFVIVRSVLCWFSGDSEVTVPDGVTDIDYEAFSGSGITSVAIPESVTRIGYRAFADCEDLESIVISGGGVEMGARLFENSGKLKEIFFEGDAPVFTGETFITVDVTVYYPAENNTWPAIIQCRDENAAGAVSWVAQTAGSVAVEAVGSAPDDGIEINGTNFPDPVFRAYVSREIDWDGNGVLDDDEIQEATGIFVSNYEGESAEIISSMKGVEFFTNLEILSCADNAITELNVSDCASLETIYCYGNELTTLDVSGCTSLEKLYCSSNRLTSLFLGDSLTFLDCGINRLSELDVSACSSLEELYCESNLLSVLELGAKPELHALACYGNEIELLDISECPKLKALTEEFPFTEYDDYCGYADSTDWQSFLSFDSFVTLVRYPMSGTCGENAYWSLNQSGVLSIYGSGDIEDYEDANATPWVLACFDGTDYNRELIYDINIEEGITAVGNNAFSGLTGLRYVDLPASLVRIGTHAFQDCSSIVVLNFIGNAPSIAADAFEGGSGSAFYPSDDDTWTEAVLQDYGGDIEWIQREAWSGQEEPQEPESTGTVVEIVLPEDDSDDSDSYSEGEYIDGETYVIDRNSPDFGNELTLTANATNAEGAVPVQWTISDKKQSFAEYTVDGNDLHILPKNTTKTGFVTVKATAQNGSKKSASVILSFTALSQGIIIEEPATRKITAGQKLQLKASIQGSPADKTVVWSVTGADANYVSVSASGLVTAKNAIRSRTVTVRASTRDGAGGQKSIKLQYVPKTDTLSIIRGEENVTGEKLTVDLNADIPETLTLAVRGMPSGSEPNPLWKLSGKTGIAVLTENYDGTVTLSPAGTGKTGSVTITATAHDGSKKSAKLTVTFGKFAQDVQITNAPETLTAGNSITLKTDIANNKALTDKTILWHIRDEDVAYAYIDDKGKLTTLAVDEPQEIMVWAEVKANEQISEPKTITVVPLAERVDLYKGGELLGDDLIGLDLSDYNYVLTGVILPEGAAQNGKWTSSNPKIAKVDENGKVTPLEEGNVTISYAAQDGSKQKASVNIYVGTLVNSIEIICNQAGAETETASVETASVRGADEGYTLKSAGITYILRAGKKLQLSTTTSPIKIKDSLLVWSVALGDDYATVSNKGLVTAKKGIREAHYIIVEARTKYFNTVKGSFVIRVKPESDDVIRLFINNNGSLADITDNTGALSIGNEKSLTVKNAKDEVIAASQITWKSKNASVVSVSDGKLTGKKQGTAEITATYKVGKKSYSAKCIIEVRNVPVQGIQVSATGSYGANLVKGAKLKLQAKPTNSDANKSTFTWKLAKEVNGSTITTTGIKIDKNGVMSVEKKYSEKKQKTVYVIASAQGKESEPFQVTVWPEASGVKISAPGTTYDSKGKVYKCSFKKGAQPELTLKATVSAKNETLQQVSWSSGNTKIAAINGSGKITVSGNGTVTFTAETLNTKTKTIKISFYGYPESVSIKEQSGKAMTVAAGKTITLKADVNGEHNIAPENKTVTWAKEESSWSSNLKTAINNYITISYPTGKNPDKTKGIITVKAIYSDDLKSIKSLIGKSSGIAVEGQNLKLLITAASAVDKNVKGSAWLTINTISGTKDENEWKAYHKYLTDKNAFGVTNEDFIKKKLIIDAQSYRLNPVGPVKYTGLDEKKHYLCTFDNGICNVNAYITLMNRFVAYYAGNDQCPFSLAGKNKDDPYGILKINGLEIMPFTFARNSSGNKLKTAVYVKNDGVEVDASSGGTKYTVLKEASARTADEKKSYNEVKTGYILEVEGWKLVRAERKFSYSGFGTKKMTKNTEDAATYRDPQKLAELLRAHPEGVYVRAKRKVNDKTKEHAFVVYGYEYLGNKQYRFFIANPSGQARQEHDVSGPGDEIDSTTRDKDNTGKGIPGTGNKMENIVEVWTIKLQ